MVNRSPTLFLSSTSPIVWTSNSGTVLSIDRTTWRTAARIGADAPSWYTTRLPPLCGACCALRKICAWGASRRDASCTSRTTPTIVNSGRLLPPSPTRLPTGFARMEECPRGRLVDDRDELCGRVGVVGRSKIASREHRDSHRLEVPRARDPIVRRGRQSRRRRRIAVHDDGRRQHAVMQRESVDGAGRANPGNRAHLLEQVLIVSEAAPAVAYVFCGSAIFIRTSRSRRKPGSTPESRAKLLIEKTSAHGQHEREREFADDEAAVQPASAAPLGHASRIA